jgi:transcriptional regulator with XRE-family HTH domain
MSPLQLRIRQERQRRGWTQQELAARVGVRRATISDLERRAVRRLDMALLERIARALRVPAKRLIE